MDTMDVKVSIVVPIYNNEEYLKDCLDSILNQSIQEIEVICVDDASTDASATIIKEYEKKDSRVKGIYYQKNQSASQARKDGVLLSKGEYLLFVDGDDLLAPLACEKLYNEMQKQPVDILQFGTDIWNWSGVTEERIIAMKKSLEPLLEELTGDAVFNACFEEKRYGFNLWNKMYEGNMCRKAMAHIEDGNFPKAQDKYAYFVIAYFAKSYRGISDIFYTYRFGSGITGHNRLSLKMFERYCSMGYVADAIERFIQKENRTEEYGEICATSRKQLLNDVLGNWMRLKKEERAKGFDMMNQYWPGAEVTAGIAKKFWWEQGKASENIVGAECLIPNVQKTGKEIKTIGTYYFRAGGGGAQRVMVMLANIWKNMGYEVVIFTDSDATDDDFNILKSIERVKLVPYQGINSNNYEERAKQLYEAVERYHIDVMVYHAWVSNVLLWDMLVCKQAGAAFVVHCHNIFSMLMRKNFVYPARMIKIYGIPDAVVTLSEADTCFWSTFNRNVYQTVNPIEVSGGTTENTEAKNIIWIGRFSEEKRPMDALFIMKRVKRAVPEAKLFMLGEISEQQREHYENRIMEMGIEKNVELCGFVQDISEYLRKASMQLMTSDYEGFPLALFEGLSHGLPCVMYELPYLSIVDGNDGIVSVEMGDKDAAAAEIIELLNDTEKRLKKGQCAKEVAESFLHFDIEAHWKKIFRSIYEENRQEVAERSKLIMMKTLFEYYEKGVMWAKKHATSEGGNSKKMAAAMLSRKIAFWGTGVRAQRYLDLHPELKIDLFIDNDESKNGSKIEGRLVMHPDKIANWKELFIIITPVKWQEIKTQLESKGLQYETDFVKAVDILELE